MLIGTSLTFYRGAAFNDELVDRISSAARVPTGTMSGAIVDGLHAVGARQLAVSTAYTCEVNELLTIFLRQKGFEVRSLQSLGAAKLVGDAARTTAQYICDLSLKSFADARRADGVLIVCGGFPFGLRQGIRNAVNNCSARMILTFSQLRRTFATNGRSLMRLLALTQW
jgi:arylmalonate decarboxylase